MIRRLSGFVERVPKAAVTQKKRRKAMFDRHSNPAEKGIVATEKPLQRSFLPLGKVKPSKAVLITSANVN
jgi:hypothetical protein